MSGSGTPTGTVNLSIDGSGSLLHGDQYGPCTLTPVTLTANGTATYTANFATTGVHTIVAQYAGDSANAPSTGSVVITIGGTSSGKGTFAMAFNPATLTVKQGSQGNETLTVTPAGGYTGTVNLTYTTSNDTALANLCLFAGTGINTNGSITVARATAVSGQITDRHQCVRLRDRDRRRVKAHGMRLIPHTKGSVKASNNAPQRSNKIPAGIAFAGLVLAGFLGRSSRKLRQLACVIALASLGLVLSACGGSPAVAVAPRFRIRRRGRIRSRSREWIRPPQRSQRRVVLAGDRLSKLIRRTVGADFARSLPFLLVGVDAANVEVSLVRTL